MCAGGALCVNDTGSSPTTAHRTPHIAHRTAPHTGGMQSVGRHRGAAQMLPAAACPRRSNEAKKETATQTVSFFISVGDDPHTSSSSSRRFPHLGQ